MKLDFGSTFTQRVKLCKLDFTHLTPHLTGLLTFNMLVIHIHPFDFRFFKPTVRLFIFDFKNVIQLLIMILSFQFIEF
jgi:hypothetical protein